MRIFALDASGKTSSVAIADDGKLIAQSFVNVGLTHSETLLTLCDRVFTDAQIFPKDIDYYAVTCGPGSFTGLRIGIATIKGLAFHSDIRCVKVPTLEALARGIYLKDVVIVPVIDARRDRVYCASFKVTKSGEYTRLSEDGVLTLEQLKDKVVLFKKPTVFIGDAAKMCERYFGDKVEVISSPSYSEYIMGSSIVSVAMEYIKKGMIISSNELTPVYMQESQAEREKKKMEAKNDCTCK